MEKLDSLKDSLTPTAKLYNWNTIKAALDTYGIRLGDDEKSLIIAGDQQIVADLLKTIKEVSDHLKTATPSPTKGGPKGTPQNQSKPLHLFLLRTAFVLAELTSHPHRKVRSGLAHREAR